MDTSIPDLGSSNLWPGQGTARRWVVRLPWPRFEARPYKLRHPCGPPADRASCESLEVICVARCFGQDTIANALGVEEGETRPVEWSNVLSGVQLDPDETGDVVSPTETF